MKLNSLILILAATFVVAACGSKSKDTSETATAPAASSVPAPAPAPAEAPENETQACEGKAAKDACSYGEVKGTCVRTESYALKCMPKKAKGK